MKQKNAPWWVPSEWFEQQHEWEFWNELLPSLPLLNLHMLLDGLHAQIEMELIRWYDDMREAQVIELWEESACPGYRYFDRDALPHAERTMAAFESQISKMTKRVIAYRTRYHRFAHDLRPAQDDLNAPFGPV